VHPATASSTPAGPAHPPTPAPPPPPHIPPHPPPNPQQLKYALVWGASAKHRPQKVGKDHVLQDEDIVQIVKKVGGLDGWVGGWVMGPATFGAGPRARRPAVG
jgi:hypothetical protein